MTSALNSVVVAAAEAEGGHHVVNELPFPPYVFGLIAAAAALLLLGILWSFRNTLALDPHGVAAGHTDPDARH